MRVRGFTLVELLVALAIMAIVSAVAVPIYQEYSIRTQRTNAEKDLMLCAQGMERLASTTFSYAGHAAGGADTGAVTANVCTPSTTVYTITLVAPTNANTFTLRATPIVPSVVDGEGIVETDASGAQRWDADASGGFDANENTWAH
jgi:type IV pilus assembly protein PilE